MIDNELQEFYDNRPKPGDTIVVNTTDFIPYRDEYGNAIRDTSIGGPGVSLKGECVYDTIIYTVKEQTSFSKFDIWHYLLLTHNKAKLSYVLRCGLKEEELQKYIEDFKQLDYYKENKDIYDLDYKLTNVLKLIKLN